QAYYVRTQGHPPGRIRKFIRDSPMASVFFPAIAPFPVPFKPFVIAQGVFQVSFLTFVIGTLAGRGMLFLAEGLFGARYGDAAKQFVITQKWTSLAIFVALILIFLVIRRLTRERAAEPSKGDPSRAHGSATPGREQSARH